MQVDFKVEKTTLTAVVSGELDHHVAGKLREKIDLKLATGIYDKFIFDFSDLKFMDSSGIAVIMGRVKYLEAAGGRVEVISNENIIKLLKMSGIDKYVDIREDEK